MIIMIPYFGDLARFRPLVDRWFASYRKLGLEREELPAVIVSDDPKALDAAKHWESGFLLVDSAPFRPWVRAGQPFDQKAAVVCAALLATSYSALVLDADAFLARDPRATLSGYRNAPIAMPLDHGAVFHFRQLRMEKPYSDVEKMCAGVQWFAAGDRRPLVEEYKRAWSELVAMPRVPWSPPGVHLIEQYAWTIAAHRSGGKTLPVTMNWAPHHIGANPEAVVNHYFDHHKWEAGVLDK